MIQDRSPTPDCDAAIRELHDKLSHILDVAQDPQFADHFVGRRVQREAKELRRLLDIIEPIRLKEWRRVCPFCQTGWDVEVNKCPTCGAVEEKAGTSWVLYPKEQT